jgi:hypothetical protein
MKKIATLVAVAVCAGPALAGDVFVNGYVKKDGTYVAPHMQTAPDHTLSNNYSTQGNYNPYTGQAGAVDPYAVKPYTPAPLYAPPARVAPTYGVRPVQPIQPLVIGNGF